MGTAQTIMLLGSLLLLVTLSMNFYSSYRSKSDLSINSEALSTAITVGESIFNDIRSRAFDEKTVSKAVYSIDSLTAPASLGPDAGESNATQFNDADDFNNYISYDTLGIFGIFKTSIKVHYVHKLDPNTVSATRTFTKRIDINVTNKYLADTLKLKHVIAY